MNLEMPVMDVLPLRPPPQELESLTGYLSRLNEANVILSRQAWRMLSVCATEDNGTEIAMDYPLSSFEGLARVTQIPAEKLRTLTFFYLLSKFFSNSMGAERWDWLRGAIVAHLRYCPRCLAERSYHSLLWRIESVRVCVDHRCRLLSLCGHCGQIISFRDPLPLITICPSCQRDLRVCRSEAIDAVDWERARGSE